MTLISPPSLSFKLNKVEGRDELQTLPPQNLEHRYGDEDIHCQSASIYSLEYCEYLISGIDNDAVAVESQVTEGKASQADLVKFVDTVVDKILNHVCTFAGG